MEEKVFMVPFAFEMYGRMEVEATNLKEAIGKAEEKLEAMSVSEMMSLTSYLENSEEIDYDGILTDENGNAIES